MLSHQPQTIHRLDYTPPAYTVERVDLRFDLHDTDTTVNARMVVKRNAHASAQEPLRLDGEALVLQQLLLDGEALGPERYRMHDDHLLLPDVPDNFILDITTVIQPQTNTELSGLYRSHHNYYTQCEAQGFRRIMYFPDRPDVMARFTTTITADKQQFPVLLSNGNLVGRGAVNKQRHWVKWVDPFRKPSYLFALVAGNLVKLEDSFITRSKRQVTLQIYVEPGNLDKCQHAMASLKRAMRWDEEVFGLEYDLDTFMIVAVSDFNMGAMENKGLNIFNTQFILARPETATDTDYENIEAVVAHEYFHNWTGNRVTCRDWFQLSLKEGLTVFRDQQFTADMGSAAVKRIDDVRTLRQVQFPEDAGPMAHPVRPDSYIEINNFYTVTVYEKGAEVVRMIHTLLGQTGFRKGMDLYFRRHDGQAVTCDDFLAAMADANDLDLQCFSRWYQQAGTPVLHVSTRHDPRQHTYTITLRQSCPATPGQPHKEPFHIPVTLALLDQHGEELPLQLAEELALGQTQLTLQLSAVEQSFTFLGIATPPVPSILRGFSAPVRLDMPRQDDELAFLARHDSDSFNRWEAAQQLALRELVAAIHTVQSGTTPSISPRLLDLFGHLLQQEDLDPVLVALTLTLPSESLLAEEVGIADPTAIHIARQTLRRALASHWEERLRERYQSLQDDAPYQYQARDAGRRSLRNLCLAYLTSLDNHAARLLAQQQYASAHNMTDRMGALQALNDTTGPERDFALSDFYGSYQQEALVVDKWFSLQAQSSHPQVLDQVQQLLEHPAFDITNPNKVRALLGAFARGNPLHFHRADGAGYQFIAQQIKRLDAINPQIAARLAGCFNRWKKYDPARQQLMRAALQQVRDTPALSRDTFEIVSKALDA